MKNVNVTEDTPAFYGLDSSSLIDSNTKYVDPGVTSPVKDTVDTTKFVPKKIIKGDHLMMFDKNKHSYAYATSHSLSLTMETQDISSKDHGEYGASEPGKITWEISTENLLTNEDYGYLFDIMLSRQPVTLYWGQKAEMTDSDYAKTVADGDYAYWSANTSGLYSGSAILTSLTINANTGERASYSATWTGAGKFAKVPVTV